VLLVFIFLFYYSCVAIESGNFVEPVLTFFTVWFLFAFHLVLLYLVCMML
jgi:hypothetical protein